MIARGPCDNLKCEWEWLEGGSWFGMCKSVEMVRVAVPKPLLPETTFESARTDCSDHACSQAKMLELAGEVAVLWVVLKVPKRRRFLSAL